MFPRRAAVLAGLALAISLAASPAAAQYYGGGLPNHGHTTTAGDGGPLSNPSISSMTLTGSLTVGGAAQFNARAKFSSATFTLDGANASASLGGAVTLPATSTLTVNALTPSSGFLPYTLSQSVMTTAVGEVDSGGTQTFLVGFTSATAYALGKYSFTFSTARTSVNYSCHCQAESTDAGMYMCAYDSVTAGNAKTLTGVKFKVQNVSNSLSTQKVSVICVGP